MEQLVKRFEPLIIVFFIAAGSYFLFRMAYLPGYISLPVGSRAVAGVSRLHSNALWRGDPVFLAAALLAFGRAGLAGQHLRLVS